MFEVAASKSLAKTAWRVTLGLAVASSLVAGATLTAQASTVTTALAYSKSASRANANYLSSATIAGDVHIYLQTSRSFQQVSFYLDDTAASGTPYAVDKVAPYDFQGTANDGSAKASDSSQVADGIHTITAVALASGRTTTTTTKFTIRNHASTAAASSSNVLATDSFYVTPNNDAAKAAAADPAHASALDRIATQPTATWLTEQTPLSALAPFQTAATNAGKTPVYVLYAIPGRDCGKYSQGGFATAAQYETFVNGVKSAVNNRKAVVIVEPDALPELSVCGLTTNEQNQRTSLIHYAVEQLQSNTVSVYIEGGGAYSNPVSLIAPRLKAAGIAESSGFALNVSAFDSTSSELTYGHQLSAAVGSKHFVVDTSRNGVGIPAGTASGSFCNIAGLALGHVPTSNTGDSLADAFLWVKYPGQSDGDCGNGAPYSGTFWPSYALGLVARS